MKRSGLPKRKKPIRRFGKKAEREREALAQMHADLRDRSKGLCEMTTLIPNAPDVRQELCGVLGPHTGHDAHHLWPSDRDRGVHSAKRALWLCHYSHMRIHANPKLAESYGLLRRSWMR